MFSELSLNQLKYFFPGCVCKIIYKILIKMARYPDENRIQIKIQKDSNQIIDFTHSFRPIYVVSRIFGQMPFSITSHSNGEIRRPRVSNLDVVWFVISSCIYIYAAFISSKSIYATLDNNFSNISTVGVVIIFETMMILGLLSIVFDMCFRLKFINILNKFTTFDEKVSLNFNIKLISYTI